LVLGLALGGARLARTLGLARPAAGGVRLRIVERVALDNRRQLHLVGCNGRMLLLLSGGGSDVLLASWTEERAP
jgi:hypothetical protein